MFRLSDVDGQAVDMLLDASGSSSGNGDGIGNHQGAVPAQFRERIEHVERIFNLLNLMPVSDPPPNLVARTLMAVESRAPIAPVAASQRPADSNQILP